MTPLEYFAELDRKDKFIQRLQNSDKIFCTIGERRDDYDVVPSRLSGTRTVQVEIRVDKIK